ncbi:hypothetical protein RUM44_009956 [Polyplax serrata]|uniref:Uncharacterized protein n=1 Tax=Polyplax serrata TaxID=468196 RepID=A0ABR1AU58_POLSC
MDFVFFSAQCLAPLGMESGIIRDDAITASSSFDSSNVGPQHGRRGSERVSEPSDVAFLLFLTAGDAPAEIQGERRKVIQVVKDWGGGLKILFRMRDKGVRRNMTWLRVENPPRWTLGLFPFQM